MEELSPVLWCRSDVASTITQSGGVISKITDSRTNGLEFNQATQASRPAYSATAFNGGPTITNVSNDFMVTTSNNILRSVSGATLISVVKYTTPGAVGSEGDSPLALFVSNGTGPLFTRLGLINATFTSNNLAIIGRRLDSDGLAYVNTSTSRASVANQWIIRVCRVDYANARVSHWTNGVLDIPNVPFQTPGTTSNTASSGTTILAAVNGGNPSANGTQLAEWAIIQSAVSDGNIFKIEGELVHRLWRLRGASVPLPTSHPYYSTPPTL